MPRIVVIIIAVVLSNESWAQDPVARTLSSLPTGWNLVHYLPSASHDRVLACLRNDDKQACIIGGSLIACDAVLGMTLSDDGLNWYAIVRAHDSGKCVHRLIHNGNVVEEFGGGMDKIAISRDGKRRAVIVKTEDGFAVSDNGKRGQSFAYIHDLSVSADGRKTAYIGETGGPPVLGERSSRDYFIVVNAVKHGPFGGVFGLRFIDNGTREPILQSHVHTGHGSYVFVDGDLLGPYSYLQEAVGCSLHDEIGFAFMSGPEKWGLRVGENSYCFPSPVQGYVVGGSGDLMVTARSVWRGVAVFWGDRRLGPFRSVRRFYLSSDGRTWGVMCEVWAGKWSVIVNGIACGLFDDASDIVISDDGRHWAVDAWRGTNRILVVDGIEHDLGEDGVVFGWGRESGFPRRRPPAIDSNGVRTTVGRGGTISGVRLAFSQGRAAPSRPPDK